MWLHICIFEIKRRLRQPSTYLYGLLFASITAVFFLTTGGAFSGSTLRLGGNNAFVNAPASLHQFFIVVHLLQMTVVAAVFGQAVYQDLPCRIYPLFFTHPISESQYLIGRFLAAAFICTLIAAAIPLGAIVANLSPLIQADMYGPHRWSSYLWPMLVSLFPNGLIMGSLFFCLATLTRRIVPVYAGMVILIIGYFAMLGMAQGEHASLACILEPFGSFALDQQSRYWTLDQRNERLLELTPLVFANRALWLSIALGTCAVTRRQFRFAHLAVGKTPAKTEDATPEFTGKLIPQKPAFDAAHIVQAGWRITHMHFMGTIRKVPFMVILGCGLLFTLLNVGKPQYFMGAQSDPYTWLILRRLGSAFAMFLIVLITFAAGEMVWRDRESGCAPLSDSLPIGHTLSWLARLIALLLLLALMLTAMGAVGVLSQLLQGYTAIDWSLYFAYLGYFRFVEFALFATGALALHSLVNHKFLAHGLLLLYYPAIMVLPGTGFEDVLYRLLDTPSVQYSAMDVFGHGAIRFHLIAAYWFGFALVLVILGVVFQPRGPEQNIKARIRLARRRFALRERVLLGLGLLTFWGMGFKLYWSMHVDQPFLTTRHKDKLAVDYENTYQDHPGWANLEIQYLQMDLDLYPQTRSLKATGSMDVINRNEKPIESFLLSLPDRVKLLNLSSPNELTLLERDERLGVYTYTLNQPLAAQASTRFHYTLELPPRGIPHRDHLRDLLHNGSHFRADLFLPSFHFDSRKVLTSTAKRRRNNLGGPPAIPAPTVMDYDISFSTDPNQVPLMAAHPLSDETTQGRRTIRYQGQSLGLVGFLSAQYNVEQTSLHDTPIDLYTRGVPNQQFGEIFRAVKDSLTYLLPHGTYPYDRVLMATVPHTAAGKVPWLPGLISFSETGFFHGKNDPSGLNLAYVSTVEAVMKQFWRRNANSRPAHASAIALYHSLSLFEQQLTDKQMSVVRARLLRNYLHSRNDNEPAPDEAKSSEESTRLRVGLALHSLARQYDQVSINNALQKYMDQSNQQETLSECLKASDVGNYWTDIFFAQTSLWELRIKSAFYASQDNHFQVQAHVTAAHVNKDSTRSPIQSPISVAIYDEEGQLLKELILEPKNEQVLKINLEVEDKPHTMVIDPTQIFLIQSPGKNHATFQEHSKLE